MNTNTAPSRRNAAAGLPYATLPSVAKRAQRAHLSHQPGTSRAIFAGLHFVRVLRNGDVNFWKVIPSGDFAADCETGDRYAEQLLAWLTHYPDTGRAPGNVEEKFDILKEIAFAMPKRERHRGIETGFWTQLSLRLMDLCGAPAPAPWSLA